MKVKFGYQYGKTVFLFGKWEQVIEGTTGFLTPNEAFDHAEKSAVTGLVEFNITVEFNGQTHIWDSPKDEIGKEALALMPDFQRKYFWRR